MWNSQSKKAHGAFSSHEKQTPWEEIVLRTNKHTQCTCTQLSMFCDNPGSVVKTRHRCSELWGSFVFWASPNFKCLFSGLISLSHLCINGECVSVCPGLHEEFWTQQCWVPVLWMGVSWIFVLTAVKSPVLKDTLGNALYASPYSWHVTAPFSGAVRALQGGPTVLWVWGSLGLGELRSLVWGAEHCPPQRGAALVTWLWPHSCPRSCHSNHWHVSGVCTAQPGCFASSAWIVQAGKDPPRVWAGEYHIVTGENFARTSQWFLEFWIYSFPCCLSALPQPGHVCVLFFFLCLSSCSSNVSVSWQLLFLVLFEIIQDSRRVSLTLSRGNKYIKWP